MSPEADRLVVRAAIRAHPDRSESDGVEIGVVDGSVREVGLRLEPADWILSGFRPLCIAFIVTTSRYNGYSARRLRFAFEALVASHSTKIGSQDRQLGFFRKPTMARAAIPQSNTEHICPNSLSDA